MTREVYEAFGFDRIEVTLQTRPEKFLGRVELWNTAEDTLRRALEQSGFTVKELPGEGAFYGPKIGFDFRDVLERCVQLRALRGALQIEVGLQLAGAQAPDRERADGARRRGSCESEAAIVAHVERFIGIVLFDELSLAERQDLLCRAAGHAAPSG